jgi:hypothetical protein
MDDINVCCPHFRTMKCGDTRQHRHLVCKPSGKIIGNSETFYKCISEDNFKICDNYKEVLDD